MYMFLTILLSSSLAFAQGDDVSGANVDKRRIQIESEARKEKARAEEERKEAAKIREHYELRKNEIDKIRGRKPKLSNP